MVGCQVLSRPLAAEGGGRRPAFTGPATQPYSATEVGGWQQLSRVSQNRAAVQSWKSRSSRIVGRSSARPFRNSTANSAVGAVEGLGSIRQLGVRQIDPPARGHLDHVRELAVKGPRRSGAKSVQQWSAISAAQP